MKKIELTEKQEESISFLLERWNTVQGRLKKAEQISQAAVVPAVNELRYAGRMLVGVLSRTPSSKKNGLPSIEEAIISASQYLTNAEHDVADALIYFYQKKVDDLNLRYGAKYISRKFPEYSEICQSLRKARKLVIESRANLSERSENYVDIFKHVDFITDRYFSLIDSEVFFTLEVETYKARVFVWKFISTLLGALLLAMLAILTFVS